MKKQNLFLIALLFITTVTFSQNLSVGVRGGLNLSTVFGDPYSSNYSFDLAKKPEIGLNLGVYASHPLNDKMSLQTELFYSRESVKTSGTENDIDWGTATETQELKCSFLSLPVFFKYNFTKHFYVMGGPQFSYLLAAKYKYRLEKGSNGQYGIDEETSNDSQYMNKLGIGIIPAVGYDLKKFSFGLRYYAGLTKLYKHNLNMKSEVFSVVVSYKVFTSKK